VLATGYANSPGLGSTQPVMYKLTAAGALVPGFATGGVFHDIVLAVQTEIYNVAIHGNQVVTAGYGRPAARRTTGSRCASTPPPARATSASAG
jgi:hypothetical protein